MNIRSRSILSPDNHLFDLARLGQLRLPARLSPGTRNLIDRLIYPILTVIFGIFWPVPLFIIAAFFVFLALIIGIDFEPILNSVQDLSAAWLIAAFVPLYLLIWAWLRIFEKRGLWTVGFEGDGALWKYGRGLITGLLLFTITLTILAMFGTISFEEGPRLQLSTRTGAAVILIFAGWMVQGGAEEVLARGFLLPILGIRFGTIAGVAVSSLIFSMLHLFNPGIGLLAIVNLILFSIFAALFALYEGGLWGICAIHGMWNWSQGSLFGLLVSGIDSDSSTLINLAGSGPDWLTGGDFGPEGGLAVTLVYGGAIGLIYVAHRRRTAGASS